LSEISFIFVPTNGNMQEENQYSTPEHAVEEMFFEDYMECVIAGVTYEELSEKQFKQNEQQIKDFLLSCYKIRVQCFQATELLINLSKNFL